MKSEEYRLPGHTRKTEDEINFQLLWLSLKRRWLPAVCVAGVVFAITVPVAFMQKLSYQATGKLLLKPDNTSSLTGVGKEIKEFSPVNEGGTETANPVKTQSEVILSNPLLDKTIAELDLRDKRGKLLRAESLKRNFKVKNIPGTDVLTLSYKSTDPYLAATVVNKLMDVYIENNILTNRADALTASKFIALELPSTEAMVRQAESTLRQFKEQNNVVNLDEEAKSAVAIIQELQTQINTTQADLAGANARFTDLQNKTKMNSQAAIALNSLNQSPGVQDVLKEFQQVEDQLAVERSRFQDDHPTVVNLKFKEDALKALLQKRVGNTSTLDFRQQVPSEELQMGESKQKLNEDLVRAEVERSGLVKRLAKLSNAKAAYEQRVSSFPKLEQQQRELQRQLDAAQSTYETLLKKVQEVRIAANQNMANARVIEPALIPEAPSLLKVFAIIGLGILGSILLAVVTVVTLEVRDSSIKTLNEAKELFGYTLLGVIPSLKKKATPRGGDKESMVPEVPVRDTPGMPICEAYRMLQANLKFLSSDRVLKVIVVTSSVPKEGKSKVSANLTATMAQMGRHVLLVDADMRHPSQHHIWKLTNASGLSDVIVGEAEFEAAVEEVMPNMDVLTAGVIPPNPLALLDSRRMASLIENFSETYDFVVIDAPPLIVAADALTLGKMTDGVLLVARPGMVNSNNAVAAKESLEQSGQNILGLVVNGVSQEEVGSYFYYPYYKEKSDKTKSRTNTSRS
ncbi:MAG: polysaccharide biosynthesis tyrosine autokinase [Chroococcidiopsidaceae cyanobacterium CP_BM_ER_R8_30]|nr:polysaccharide biosynthesis tyrosine autokinase [Chroococcidiopsidaceae cyanobacterium CP_BM_ER_R8_30]